jgi:hypothetical protein
MSPILEVRLSDTIEAEVAESISGVLAAEPTITIEAEVPELLSITLEVG